MLLSKVLKDGEYDSAFSPTNIHFSTIVSNTENIEKDCVFVCLCGQHFDAHAMAPFAVSMGASAIIAELGKIVAIPTGFPVFYVKDTRSILSHMISRFHGERWKKSRLIAITGTNGKTSTLYLTEAILRQAGFRVAMIGTVEVRFDGQPFPLSECEEKAIKTMTTPDPAFLFPILCRMADAHADFIIMEASSHALAQKKLLPLHFELGLFTNLSPEHLDYHQNMEDYLRAKVSLFPLCDTAVLNADSPYAYEIMRRTAVNAVLVGSDPCCEYHTHDVVAESSFGSSFTVSYQKKSLKIEMPLPGLYNVENARLAIAAALTLGIQEEIIGNALANFAGIPGRLERLTLDDYPFSIFIDYAHTEAALKKLLQTVRSFRAPSERIVLLFGCGGNRDKSKRAPMGTVAEMYADFTIVTSDNPRSEKPLSIIKDILEGMPDSSRRRVIVNRESAIRYAIKTAKKGDIILLVGKGHETYEITAEGLRTFDERAIILSELDNIRNRQFGEPS